VLEEELSTPVVVYAPTACLSRCPAGGEGFREIAGSLVAAGVRVVERLSQASTLAYTGYSRPRISVEEAAERVARRLRGEEGGG